MPLNPKPLKCPLTRGKKKRKRNNHSCLALVDLRAVGQMHCSSRLPFLHRTLTVVSTTEAQCCSLERQPAVGSLTCHVSAWLVSGLLGATKMLFEVNEASAYFFTSNHWVIMHSQCQGCTENIRELEGGMSCPPSSSPPTVFLFMSS